MFTVLVIVSVFYQGYAVVNYGTDFITAFPENIAYYYPTSVSNTLKITALNDNTKVSIIFSGTTFQEMTINSGSINLVNLPTEAEEYKLGLSLKSVRITSNNNITVFSISKREDSVQTSIVQPIANLGKSYMVPFPNYTELLSLMNTYSPFNWTSSSIVNQTYNQFRLLIINAEAKNTSVAVNLAQSPGSPAYSQFTLGPFQLMQMQTTMSVLQVSSSAYLAVLLTHPCMDTKSCKCSMLVQQLQPTELQQSHFLVPPRYTLNHTRLILTSDQTVELSYGSPPLTEILQPGSFKFLPFFPSLENGSASIMTSQPASLSLIHTGVMMGLIPLSMFSACYLVHLTSTTRSEALLIAETYQTQYVHMDQNPVSLTWNMMNGTKYSWGILSLTGARSCIFWHPYSKIAVYVLEKMVSLATYGGPAISIHDEPDSNGCVVNPEYLVIGENPMSWQQSREYCISKGASLVSPSLSVHQNMVAKTLTDAKTHGKGWIGLRRSLTTMAWYWQNNDDFGFTSWDKNQPDIPAKGMCAFMQMDPGKDYTWRSDLCCSSKMPVCYVPTQYINLVNPYT